MQVDIYRGDDGELGATATVNFAAVGWKRQSMNLSGVGIWSPQLRYGDQSESADAAAELEELGFRALWIPDVGQTPVLDSVAHLLSSTTGIAIATGILNLWMNEPADVAASYACVDGLPRRSIPHGYRRQSRTVDRRDGAGAIPQAAGGDRVVSRRVGQCGATRPGRRPRACGARAEDAGARCRHARAAPTRISPRPSTPTVPVNCWVHGPLLLPEQTAILTEDADEARTIGTGWLRMYLAMPNYANSLLRLGFSADDVGSVSDRLFDAIIVWGDEEAVMRRVNEHLSAGADHVCVQVLTADLTAYPREQWRRIASALQ